RIALAGPASIALAEGGAEIRDLAIVTGGGRIAASGHVGQTLALDLAIKDWPLSAAEVALPGLGLSGTLDGEARITGTATSPSGGQRLSGRLAVDATLRGTAAAPLASGVATMSGGSFQDPLQGVQFEGIQTRILAQGEELVIERASATTPNGGTVSASGRVRLE